MRIYSSASIAANPISAVVFLVLTFLQIVVDVEVLRLYIYLQFLYGLNRTIPGIGPLTAASILVEIGDVKRFDTFYHLNSFVGLLPMEHSSGGRENKSILTVRKHRQLRSELVESA